MTRRILCGLGIAAMVMTTVPATANAAPVEPARAVLTAAELPPGSTSYTAFPVTLPPAPRLTIENPCDAKSQQVADAIAGVKAVEAEAWRRDTHFYTSVIGRPVASEYEQLATTCVSRAPQRLSSPPDLAHVNPWILRSGPRRVEAMADVRGVTVGVIASAPEGKTLDTETFWQVLRAQVAKVERQP